MSIHGYIIRLTAYLVLLTTALVAVTVYFSG